MKVGLKATARPRRTAIEDLVVADAPAREATLRDPIVERAIAHASDGDADALRYLYIRYADGVYGYVRNLVRREEDAYAVTQGVFSTLTSELGSYDAERAPFQVWLLRLAHSRSTEHFRARRRRFVRS